MITTFTINTILHVPYFSNKRSWSYVKHRQGAFNLYPICQIKLLYIFVLVCVLEIFKVKYHSNNGKYSSYSYQLMLIK